MNNKGFAITTILYGTLILFLMLLMSMLGILSTYKDRLEMLIEKNNGARSIINGSYEEASRESASSETLTPSGSSSSELSPSLSPSIGSSSSGIPVPTNPSSSVSAY